MMYFVYLLQILWYDTSIVYLLQCNCWFPHKLSHFHWLYWDYCTYSRLTSRQFIHLPVLKV
jgi:hypothetical protein